MAVLQAARARALGLPVEAAYSWGLNRAIFIAAAKRGFRAPNPGSVEEAARKSERDSRSVYRLGSDEAYRDPNASGLVFMIGDEAQTVADFEKQVISRFGTNENFGSAWAQASRLVNEFDRSTLESSRGFYDEVYRPRRDELSDEWTRKYSPPMGSKKKARSESSPGSAEGPRSTSRPG